MKQTEQTDQAAQRFAARFKYEIVKFRCQYKNCLAYNATSKTLKNTYYGYPIFVIVRDDFCCRLANVDEVFEIMELSNR